MPYCVYGGKVAAQGNLQFNRVVTYVDTPIVTTPGNVAVGTVPTNKVWKIESYSIQGQPGGGGNIYASIGINNMNLGFNGALISSPIGAGSPSSTIWLKAGDVLNVFYWLGSGGSETSNVKYFFSIIEFNVVP